MRLMKDDSDDEAALTLMTTVTKVNDTDRNQNEVDKGVAMQAVQFQEFGQSSVLKIAELPRPHPQGNEVLIAVTAAGVSYVDVRQRQGAYNKSETRVGGVVLPNVPGLQAVGTVVELGPEADPALKGRKVVAAVDKGAYAELLIAPSTMCVPVPDGLDDAVLAVLPMQGLTAYCLLTKATVLRPGESVLVHAAGSGVGALAVQIARILGAGKIIATASTKQKRDFALSLGADVAIDYNAAGWTDEVLKETGGKGVDILLESLGGEIFEQNFACLAPFGRYLVFGSTQGIGKPFEARRLMTKCQTITGLYLPFIYSRPDIIREGLSFMVEHCRIGDLTAKVDAQLPLAEAGKAQQMLEDRKVTGAVVLKPRATSH
jgi:NADPH:quinone reductase